MRLLGHPLLAQHPELVLLLSRGLPTSHTRAVPREPGKHPVELRKFEDGPWLRLPPSV